MQDTILPQNIKLKVPVDNWQEALQKAGNLLVLNGFITEQYIQDMINAVKEFGPYIVLAPGIALGHARPSESVMKTGISLITLASPINFGSQENDPVSIVLALCAKDNISHINMLTQVCAFLDQDCSMQFLMNSYSSDELASAINTFKQKESS